VILGKTFEEMVEATPHTPIKVPAADQKTASAVVSIFVLSKTGFLSVPLRLCRGIACAIESLAVRAGEMSGEKIRKEVYYRSEPTFLISHIPCAAMSSGSRHAPARNLRTHLPAVLILGLFLCTTVAVMALAAVVIHKRIRSRTLIIPQEERHHHGIFA
jgi:hypothetical protein